MGQRKVPCRVPGCANMVEPPKVSGGRGASGVCRGHQHDKAYCACPQCVSKRGPAKNGQTPGKIEVDTYAASTAPLRAHSGARAAQQAHGGEVESPKPVWRSYDTGTIAELCRPVSGLEYSRLNTIRRWASEKERS